MALDTFTSNHLQYLIPKVYSSTKTVRESVIDTFCSDITEEDRMHMALKKVKTP